MTLQQLRVYDGESEACDGSICVAGFIHILSGYLGIAHKYYCVKHILSDWQIDNNSICTSEFTMESPRRVMEAFVSQVAYVLKHLLIIFPNRDHYRRFYTLFVWVIAAFVLVTSHTSCLNGKSMTIAVASVQLALQSTHILASYCFKNYFF